MKEAIIQNLPQGTLNQCIYELLSVQIVRLEHFNVRKSESIHPLHRKNLARRQFTVHFGDKHIRNTRVQLIESLSVGRLGYVVDFSVNELPKVIDDGTEIDVSVEEGRNSVPKGVGPPPQNVQVEGYNLFALGPLNFDGNQLAIRQEPGLVDC